MAKKNRRPSDRVPFMEALRLNRRAFGIWWKRHPQVFLSSAAHAAVGALTPYAAIYLSARIIDELAGARDPQALTRLVIIALITAAALALLTAALERWKNSRHAATYYQQVRVYAEKLLSMDFRGVDDPRTHDLRSQIMQNARWGGWGLMKSIWNFDDLVAAICKILGAAALTVTLFTLRVPAGAGALTVLNHPLCVVLIVTVMLAVTLTAPTFTNRANAYWARQSDDAKLGNRVFSFFGSMAHDRARSLDVRIYRQDAFCKHALEKTNIFGPGSRIARYAKGPMGGCHALAAAVSNAFTGIVYAFVCLKAWGGAFGVGAVTQYVGAVTALSGGVSLLISTLGDMRNNASFLRTTFEFLDIPNEMYRGSLTVEKRSDRNFDVEFRNVGFRYPGTEAWALRYVSIRFRVGQRLAVVGRNGSGKTTFIKLLCRLYDPTEGEILLNGIDIRKYDYGEYMSIFSVVFQDFRLLSYGLGQNVAAKEDFDRGRAEECLEAAGFGARLRTLPQGVDTCLYRDFDEKGVEISGGEAQKIALARALYKDAPFIVLDEPTAALDPIAEFEVYSKFNEIVGDKTAIFISHRLSSCRFCDEIAVFDEGRIVQTGAHDDLVAAEGKYRELWFAQAQYYAQGSVG